MHYIPLDLIAILFRMCVYDFAKIILSLSFPGMSCFGFNIKAMLPSSKELGSVLALLYESLCKTGVVSFFDVQKKSLVNYLDWKRSLWEDAQLFIFLIDTRLFSILSSVRFITCFFQRIYQFHQNFQIYGHGAGIFNLFISCHTYFNH